MASLAPSSISPLTLSRLVSLYPATVRNVYRAKIIAKANRVSKGAANRLKRNVADSKEAEITAAKLAQASADPTVPHPLFEKQVEKLYETDVWRFETLPARLLERRDSDEPDERPAKKMKWFTKKDPKKEKNKRKDAELEPPPVEKKEEDLANIFLEKEELVRLVEWKVKHNNFGPTLLGLIKTNPAAHIKYVTRAAFNALPDPSTSPDEVPSESLKILYNDLRGAGPATASLILSLAAKVTAKRDGTDYGNGTSGIDVPFFSDELFLWLRQGVYPGSESKFAGDPKKQIKYTPREYEKLYEVAIKIKERLNEGAFEPDTDREQPAERPVTPFSMEDIEKAAFVVVHIDISGYYGKGEGPADEEAPDSSAVSTEEEAADDDTPAEPDEKKTQKRKRGDDDV